MAKSSKPAEAVEDVAAEEEPQSIHQVRDILFGAQMRTVDRRIGQIESKFHRDLEKAKTDLTKAISDLTAAVSKQGEQLTAKIAAESQKRTDAMKSLRTDMRNGFKEIERSLANLDKETTKSDAELRDQMMALGKSLSDEINTQADRLDADIARYVLELRSEKTDIASLVEIHTDAARRLAAILEEPTT
jgi:seryl-tRNA synthetase